MYCKVLLVAPPSSSYLGAVRPPAGLGYLAQALREAGIECSAEDMRSRGSVRVLLKIIRNLQPDLIGVSLVSFEYLRTYELIHSIKTHYPEIPIIVGGPHVSVLGQAVLEECPAIDFGILYEGERSLVQLCQGKKPLGDIPGLLSLTWIVSPFPAIANTTLDDMFARSISSPAEAVPIDVFSVPIA
jgi:anaerobic magnesium-protoporphyrin IX monomethyl ester cyclase